MDCTIVSPNVRIVDEAKRVYNSLTKRTSFWSWVEDADLDIFTYEYATDSLIRPKDNCIKEYGTKKRRKENLENMVADFIKEAKGNLKLYGLV